MHTTNTETTLTPTSQGPLAALRALARTPAASAGDLLRVASSQARLLTDLLPVPAWQIPDRLTSLIPAVLVERVTALPVAGISFWARGHWRIQVPGDDPDDIQAFTVLSQLKHIIDHPIRTRLNLFSASEWDKAAEHFATQVLACETCAVAA